MRADAESSCTESRTDSWFQDGARNPWSAPTTELWAPTAVAYNLRLTFADAQTNGTSATGAGGSGAHNGSGNAAADTELDPIPQERDEHPNTYSAADTDAQVQPPTRDQGTDGPEPGASRAPP